MRRLVTVALTLVAAVSVAPLASAQAMPVTYRVDTKDPVVFITIDDGIVTSQAGLETSRSTGSPSRASSPHPR